MIKYLKKIYRRLQLFLKIHVLKKYRIIDRWFWEKGDETYRLNYVLNENSIVFDLGGYKGEWADQIYRRYTSKIFIFEPVTAFRQIISEKFKNNSSIRLYPFGLGGESRTDIIYLNDNGSTTHKASGSGQEEINIVGINRFFEENNIETVDLMKINIEGEEYPLLNALISEQAHLKIRNIQVQFHAWMPGAEEKRMQIRKELAKSHKLTYDFPFVWENWQLMLPKNN